MCSSDLEATAGLPGVLWRAGLPSLSQQVAPGSPHAGHWTTDASSCAGVGEGSPGANDRQLFLPQEAFVLGTQEGPARLLSCQGLRPSQAHFG